MIRRDAAARFKPILDERERAGQPGRHLNEDAVNEARDMRASQPGPPARDQRVTDDPDNKQKVQAQNGDREETVDAG